MKVKTIVLSVVGVGAIAGLGYAAWRLCKGDVAGASAAVDAVTDAVSETATAVTETAADAAGQ